MYIIPDTLPWFEHSFEYMNISLCIIQILQYLMKNSVCLQMGLQSHNQYNWVKNALSGDSTYTPIQGAVMCCETWKHCQFAADLQELEMHFAITQMWRALGEGQSSRFQRAAERGRTEGKGHHRNYEQDYFVVLFISEGEFNVNINAAPDGTITSIHKCFVLFYFCTFTRRICSLLVMVTYWHVSEGPRHVHGSLSTLQAAPVIWGTSAFVGKTHYFLFDVNENICKIIQQHWTLTQKLRYVHSAAL